MLLVLLMEVGDVGISNGDYAIETSVGGHDKSLVLSSSQSSMHACQRDLCRLQLLDCFQKLIPRLVLR
jgi:hypothetical protein